MNADVFIDTNVLLYSIDEDPASASKRGRAQQVLLTEQWGWPTQVAAEFFVNATSPKRPFRLGSADAARFVETWLAFPTAAVTPEILRSAIALHDRFSLSSWDAAILAAAAQLGCRTVLSEDLNHGQDCASSIRSLPNRPRRALERPSIASGPQAVVSPSRIAYRASSTRS